MFQYLLILSSVVFVTTARSTGNRINITRELLEERWVVAAVGVSNEEEFEDYNKGNVDQCIWFSARPTMKRNLCNVYGNDHLLGSLEFFGVSGIATDRFLAVGPVYEVQNGSREILNTIKSMKCKDAQTRRGKKVIFAISPIDDSLDHFLLVANSGGPRHFVLQTSIITKELYPLSKLKSLIKAVDLNDKVVDLRVKNPPLIPKCFVSYT